jgi:Icc-related predicted phosphoesterase
MEFNMRLLPEEVYLVICNAEPNDVWKNVYPKAVRVEKEDFKNFSGYTVGTYKLFGVGKIKVNSTIELTEEKLNG